MLRSGNNMDGAPGKYGCAAEAIAVQGKRLALASLYPLIRLATDGTSGGLNLEGPEPSIKIMGKKGKPSRAAPISAAFSPDGKYVYFTGYSGWLPCVTRLEYAGDGKLELFAGSWKQSDAKSTKQAFKVPLSVACDAKGRVYVADFMNNRIQVYTPDGKVFKSVGVKHPVYVAVDPKSGKIHVGSWMRKNDFIKSIKYKIPATYTRLGPVENPKVEVTCPLPLNSYNPTVSWNRTGGKEYRMTVDFWTGKPTIWLVGGLTYTFGGWGVTEQKTDLKGTGILLLQEKGGKLVARRDFNTEVVKKVKRAAAPKMQRQRLYVHPRTGKLYIAEGDSGVAKSFRQLVEINPDTGKVRLRNLPLTAEDMAIDLAGHFYLRDDFYVARFDPRSWREVPFDYGEERTVGFDKMKGNHKAISALVLPSTGRMGWWHLGGMSVSPNGNVAVTCCNRIKKAGRRETSENPYAKRGKGGGIESKYTPTLYPGRRTGWEMHIWNRHGQPIHKDAVPGMGETDGIGIDKDDNLYVMANPNRVLKGKPYFLSHAETLMKFKPGKGKIVSASKDVKVPLPREGWPDRPRDIGSGWVEGAEWMYGGVGFAGWRSGASCICWNTRPALDLLARSFAAEIDHFSVAVLDTNGNLILRIGQYGNVDDGKPLVNDGGPKNTRSIGGDEVALFHAAYLGTHTDKRLFIADVGNSRIVSVKLDYHSTKRIKLKSIED